MKPKNELIQKQNTKRMLTDTLGQNKSSYYLINSRTKSLRKTQSFFPGDSKRNSSNSKINKQIIYKRKKLIKNDNSINQYIKIMSQTMQNFCIKTPFMQKIKNKENENYLITKKYVVNKINEINKIKYIQKYWKKLFNKICTINKMRYINNNTLNIINDYNYNYEFQYIDLSDKRRNSSFTNNNSKIINSYMNSFNPINNKIKKINNFNFIILKNIQTKFHAYKNNNPVKHPIPFYRKRFPFYLNKSNNEKKKLRENKNKIIQNDLIIWVKKKLRFTYNNENMFKYQKIKPNKYLNFLETEEKEKKLFLNYERYYILNKPKISKKFKKTKSYANIITLNFERKFKSFSQRNMAERKFILNKNFIPSKKIINPNFVDQFNDKEPLLMLERKLIMKKPCMK